jgi:hypothetical protein
MSPRSRRLNIEILEDRSLPSATVWNTPWPDASHLTISFAPDTTNISGDASSLSSVLANAGPNAKQAILSAFQTWADYANINLGLVADGGQAFGVGKAIENDARFGDIRIGARPLDGDVVAVTSPFSYLSTYSGDVVLNSSQAIGTTYNLFAVALHEAGHALGLPDNNDPNSAMYEYYTGANVSLDASDIAAIQALYGARTPDGNSGSIATAANYLSPVNAAINTDGDADFYRFNTPLLFTATTVHLQAEGLSLLDAQVSVFNSRGQMVASAQATDPTNNDLTLNLNRLSGLSSYYVEVSSPNGGVFDVGSYELSITNNLTTAVGDLLNGAVGLLSNVGHSLLGATNLVSSTLDSFTGRASLTSPSEVDVYQVQAPPASSGNSAAMVATVWNLGNANLAPRFQVLDGSGNTVAFEVLTNNSGASIIQVLNPVAGEKYYFKVSSATGQTGRYEIAVNFLSSAVSFPMNASGALNAATPSASANLTVDQSQVMHFVLAASQLPANSNTVVVLTIVDSHGNVVENLQVAPGDAESVDLFLQAGSYSVLVSEVSENGTPPQALQFELSAIGITDPVAIAMANPTSTPAGSSPPPSSPPPSSPPPSSPPPSSPPPSSPPPSSPPPSVPPPTAAWTSTTPTGNATWN